MLLRPTRTSDTEAMQDLFYALRPEDLYTRFFTHLASLSDDKAAHLCSVDYDKEMAFVLTFRTSRAGFLGDYGVCCV